MKTLVPKWWLVSERVGVMSGLQRKKGSSVNRIEPFSQAVSQGRIVVTHDLAFGRSALQSGASFVGIVYLRPGHISGTFVLRVVDALRDANLDVQPPFVVVAERRETAVRVRVRVAPPW